MNSCASVPARRKLIRVLTLIMLFTGSGPAGWAGEGDFTEFGRVTMRLGYLQQTWNRHVVEQDPVTTQVGEARVSGYQATTVDVSLSTSPSVGTARMSLHSSGHVQSNTLGVTQQAQVQSLGNHTFQLTKDILFDGRCFLTRRSHGSIQARTQPVAIRTALSGIPILEHFAQQIAWRETYRRQPRTNSIVVRQVADDVVPQFDDTVEKELAAANRELARNRERIAKLFPGQRLDYRADSTSDSLSLRLGTLDKPGSVRTHKPLQHSVLKSNPLPQEDLVITLSDHVINDLIRQLPLAGQTIPDTGLLQLRELSFNQLPDSDPAALLSQLDKAMDNEPRLFSIQLADIPLEVLFEHGRIAIVLRFRTLAKNGDPSPDHRLTIYVTGGGAGPGQWSIRVDEVDVRLDNLSDEESSMIGILQGQTRALEDLPPTILPRRLSLKESTGMSDVSLWQMRIRDGVLRASYQLAR